MDPWSVPWIHHIDTDIMDPWWVPWIHHIDTDMMDPWWVPWIHHIDTDIMDQWWVPWWTPGEYHDGPLVSTMNPPHRHRHNGPLVSTMNPPHRHRHDGPLVSIMNRAFWTAHLEVEFPAQGRGSGHFRTFIQNCPHCPIPRLIQAVYQSTLIRSGHFRTLILKCPMQ